MLFCNTHLRLIKTKNRENLLIDTIKKFWKLAIIVECCYFLFWQSTMYCDDEIDDQNEMEVDDCLVKNYGEFNVTLNKINGSLGFSLRSDPEDTTALR